MNSKKIILLSVFTILMASYNQAYANFIWPPALYFSSFSLWWVVPVGLLIEYAVLQLFLRFPVKKTARIVLITNAVSALMGFVLTYPITFYGQGIDCIAKNNFFIGPTAFIISFSLFILVLNITIELVTAIKLFHVEFTRKAVSAFAVANILSFAVIVLGALKLLSNWIKNV